MIVDKNTTLEELIKYHKHCLSIAEKNMGAYKHWCDGCQYFDPVKKCEVSGEMVPCNWLLPRVDYE
ncbi:MAG: hypothetical protein J6U36_07790 [Oscillospiraceae bacterium]|nr:hypothetical protein [Oscillospiraceae bacterium]